MRGMKPAHMLVLVSCVVLACGGGCFQSKPVSHCTPAPAPEPAVTTPAEKPPEQPAQAKAPAASTTEETVVVQAQAEQR